MIHSSEIHYRGYIIMKGGDTWGVFDKWYVKPRAVALGFLTLPEAKECVDELKNEEA